MAALATALLAPACDGGPGSAATGGYYGSTDRGAKDPGTIYVGGSEPEHLDPAKCAEVNSSQYAAHLFEGLATYGPAGLRPAAGVARAWDRSDDGRSYRFHLRPEARWSDGRPVTSGDFEYAWKRTLRPETASRAAPDLYPLKNAEPFNKGRLRDDSLVGVRARDDLTLDVELEHPTPYFIDLLCRPAYAPVRRDVIEPLERRGEGELWVRPENIVVNGPYTLEAWRFRYELTMSVNPHHWARDALRVRRIVWVQSDSARAALNLYRTAEVDILGGAPPPEHIPLLLPLRDTRRQRLLATIWFDINTRTRPVDDPRVRRALNLAIDKQAIAAIAANFTPATHYVPESTGGGYAEGVAADRAAGRDPFGDGFDPERARASLGEAGYEVLETPDGRRAQGFPPLQILYSAGSEVQHTFVVAVQDLWRRHLGITASLRREEWRVQVKTVRDRDYQVALSAWTADYNHPHTFLGTFLSSSPANPTGWADEGYDELVGRAMRAPDPEEGTRLYRRAEARALADMSRIPLFFAMQVKLVKPWVSGLEENGRGMILARWLAIDPAWRAGAAAPGAAPQELPPPGRLSAP